MDYVIVILISYILDLIFGDPTFIKHPVEVIGSFINFLEKRFYRFSNKKFWGGVLVLIVVTSTLLLSYFLSKIWLLNIYFLYTTLATNSLGREGKKVYNLLKTNDLENAKKELSYLVSRDTGELEKRDVIRSTMETISENIVDGIVSPLFYMFIGGLPLAMAYKSINTLDSMLGYKNNKYKDFGYCSAKLDDLANLIPARLTGGLLIPIATFLLKYDYRNSIKIFFRDRYNHASPNSAHPESAVAGALGVQFGGKTKYFGVLMDKPTIGDRKKEFEVEDIEKNLKIMYITSILALIIFSTVYLILFFL